MALATSLEPALKPSYAWEALKDKNLPGVQVEVVLDPAAGLPQQLTDVPEEHWAYEILTQQAERGILPMDEEGRFRGQKLLTLKDTAEQWDLHRQSGEGGSGGSREEGEEERGRDGSRRYICTTTLNASLLCSKSKPRCVC